MFCNLRKFTHNSFIFVNYQVTIDIMRRHANILNELGVLYMNKAASIASSYGVPSEAEMKLWKISYNYFEKGIKSFEALNDRLGKFS